MDYIVAKLLVASGLAAALAPAAVKAPTPPASWTEGWVIANNIRIHYWRTGGAKPPMVLLHGSSDDGLCWTALARELEGRYDVIMPDARGHGQSDPPSASDPADAQVDDLAGLIRELKLDKPIVMGHSMGASAAAWFGAKYPDMARAIILEDPGLLPRPAGAAPPGGAGTQETRRAAILARNNQSLEQLVEGCMNGSPKWGRAECEVWAPSKRMHHPNTALRGFSGRPPMTEIFAKITVPVLILKADAAADIRAKNEQAATKLAKGKIVHIDGAGHNVRRENKPMLLRELNAFLASI
ncbi:MAG: alpha/beta hydrolase [Bryobacteraceae bacterium]